MSATAAFLRSTCGLQSFFLREGLPLGTLQELSLSLLTSHIDGNSPGDEKPHYPGK